MKRIVLGPHAGGLGDNLLFSTLPELFAMEDYEVFISNKVPPRNPEITQLVWTDNKYVTGFTEEAPWEPAGNEKHSHALYVKLAQRMSPIRAIQAVYGFANRYAFSKDRPYVNVGHFLPPRTSLKWSNKYVCDLNSISQGFSLKSQGQFLNHFAKAHDIQVDDIIFIGSRFYPPATLSVQHYTVQDIYEYCDILANARGVALMESGGAVLAAAVRVYQPPAWVLFTTQSYNDRLFVFPQNHYVVTSDMTPDYVSR